MRTHLHRLVDGLLRDHLRPHLTAIGSDLPVEVVAGLHAAAALGPLVWLVDQDFPYDPAALATMYHRVAVPGVLAARRR